MIQGGMLIQEELYPRVILFYKDQMNGLGMPNKPIRMSQL